MVCSASEPNFRPYLKCIHRSVLAHGTVYLGNRDRGMGADFESLDERSALHLRHHHCGGDRDVRTPKGSKVKASYAIFLTVCVLHDHRRSGPAP